MFLSAPTSYISLTIINHYSPPTRESLLKIHLFQSAPSAPSRIGFLIIPPRLGKNQVSLRNLGTSKYMSLLHEKNKSHRNLGLLLLDRFILLSEISSDCGDEIGF